jgi:hypothetical protein
MHTLTTMNVNMYTLTTLLNTQPQVNAGCSLELSILRTVIVKYKQKVISTSIKDLNIIFFRVGVENVIEGQRKMRVRW